MDAPWFDVLKIARRTAPLTRYTLAEAAELPQGHAAAWLSKFKKWGYVRRTPNRIPGSGPRQVVVYEITTWGRKVKPPNLGQFIEQRRQGGK